MRGSRTTFVLALGVLSAIASMAPTGAAAQGAPVSSEESEILARAKARFEAGRAAYQAGRYEEAISEFGAAQAIRPSPILNYNIARCYDNLGSVDLALQYYRKYLAERPDAQNRAEVEERVVALQRLRNPGQTPPPPAPAPVAEEPMEDMPHDGQRPGAYSPPAPVAPPGTVPVLIIPKRKDSRYTVRVGDASCATTCTLFLEPGQHDFHVDGKRRFTRTLIIEAPTRVRVQHLRLGHLISGTILMGLGVGSYIALGGLLGTATIPLSDAEIGAAVFLALFGSVALPIGIPLTVQGDRDAVQDVGPDYRASRRRRSRLRLAGVGIAPSSQGASASISLTF